MRVDLHVHTTASDGSLSPAAVVGAAIAGGLDVLAVTDHDTTSGVVPAAAAADDAIVIVPGVELSTTLETDELHILGYFIDPLEPALLEHAAIAANRREQRMLGMIDRLAGLGVVIPFGEVLEEAGPDATSLARPHLARVMVRRGIVPSIPEAFNQYLGDSGPAFVPTAILTPMAAIQIIHGAGGLAVWAHPRLDVFEREIRRLADAGLDGVEAFRPRTGPTDSQRLEETARSLGLVTSGGSDWHGSWHGRLGDYAVGEAEVGDLLSAGGVL